jgi:hypothetical protein
MARHLEAGARITIVPGLEAIPVSVDELVAIEAQAAGPDLDHAAAPVMDADQRAALLRIFDLAENRPDIREVAHVALSRQAEKERA